MVGKAIHVIAAGDADWLVRENGGRDFGHYPTRKEAEAVGHKLARKRTVELVVHDGGGKVKTLHPPMVRSATGVLRRRAQLL